MKLRSVFRACALMIVLLCIASASAEGMEKALPGEWVYQNDPEVTVITLKEDGHAVYGGEALTWQAEEDSILLTDDTGTSFRLPYETNESGMTVWLPTRFTRISEIGEAGEIIGTWKAEGKSQSSFVFTEEGRFLEDGVFTGSFLNDPEQGCITLQYAQGLFEDTLILYSFDGNILVIFYPWNLARK